MKLLDAAVSLELKDWLRGLVGAAISGGSSAVSGGTGAGLIAPDQFNIHTGKLYELMGAMFCFNAFVSLTKFLSVHPLPESRIVTTTVAVSRQEGNPPVTVVTATETHQEPVAPKG